MLAPLHGPPNPNAQPAPEEEIGIRPVHEAAPELGRLTLWLYQRKANALVEEFQEPERHRNDPFYQSLGNMTARHIGEPLPFPQQPEHVQGRNRKERRIERGHKRGIAKYRETAVKTRQLAAGREFLELVGHHVEHTKKDARSERGRLKKEHKAGQLGIDPLQLKGQIANIGHTSQRFEKVHLDIHQGLHGVMAGRAPVVHMTGEEEMLIANKNVQEQKLDKRLKIEDKDLSKAADKLNKRFDRLAWSHDKYEKGKEATKATGRGIKRGTFATGRGIKRGSKFVTRNGGKAVRSTRQKAGNAKQKVSDWRSSRKTPPAPTTPTP